MKNIVVLGSTGSIGTQTLDVVRALPGDFRVAGLSAGRNLDLLAEQIAEFNPRMVWCEEGRDSIGGDGASLVPPEEMVVDPDVDLVMVATTGRAGLVPTLNALRAGKAVALSNKEVVVMAGELVTRAAAKHGAPLLPVDSEPSAIWQCLRGEDEPVRRLIITASGGPFRTRPLDEIAGVTPAEALAHPTWVMGRKITIDSSTLMNKGFEVIESRWLFDIPFDRIDVVVHPQSVIHSMIECADGSVKAQMGPPDMRLPIQAALAWPCAPRQRQPAALRPARVAIAHVRAARPCALSLASRPRLQRDAGNRPTRRCSAPPTRRPCTTSSTAASGSATSTASYRACSTGTSRSTPRPPKPCSRPTPGRAVRLPQRRALANAPSRSGP